MIEWIVVGALALFILIGPPIKRGGSLAEHDPLLVKLPTDATSIAQGNHPDGRRVQEVGEWRLLWLFGLAWAAAVAFAFDGIIAAIGAALAGFLGHAFLNMLRFIDTAGHGAEIMVAEADGWEEYRDEEIDRMIGLDTARKGMTPEQVGRQIHRLRWLSRIIKVLAW